MVAGALRQRTRLVLAALVLLVTVLELTTGLFDWVAFQQLADGLAAIPEKIGSRPLFVFGAFILGAGWAALGVRGLRVRGLAVCAAGDPEHDGPGPR